jgi:hypothetical protein
MPKAVLVVYSRPSSVDREDEYNEWYSETHIPEVRTVPGFTSARRYKLSTSQSVPLDDSVPTYLAVYDVEADDLGHSLDLLAKGVEEGSIYMSDALEMDPPPTVALYELIEP